MLLNHKYNFPGSWRTTMWKTTRPQSPLCEESFTFGGDQNIKYFRYVSKSSSFEPIVLRTTFENFNFYVPTKHILNFGSQIYDRSSCIITGRNEVVAKVMFLHVCVILFTGGGLQVGRPPQAGRNPPPGQGEPPWAGRIPPPGQGEPPRAGRTPPGANPPGADITPPPGSSIRSMSGRYASYWNALLFHRNV